MLHLCFKHRHQKDSEMLKMRVRFIVSMTVASYKTSSSLALNGGMLL